jgi:hypothetical protein
LSSTSAAVPCSTTPPTVHEDDAIGRLTGKGDFVRHHDHREAAAGQLPHGAEDLADQLGIQSGGRFVEKHQLGFHGERTGDGNALLLAAGELARVGLGAVSEADLFEEPLRPVNRDGPHLPLDANRSLDDGLIPARRRRLVITEVLEDLGSDHQRLGNFEDSSTLAV